MKYRVKYMMVRVTAWTRDEEAIAAARARGIGDAVADEVKERLEDGVFRAKGLPLVGEYTTDGKPCEADVRRHVLRKYAGAYYSGSGVKPTDCEVRWECKEVEE